MKKIVNFNENNMMSYKEMDLIKGGGFWRKDKTTTIDNLDGTTTTVIGNILGLAFTVQIIFGQRPIKCFNC